MIRNLLSTRRIGWDAIDSIDVEPVSYRFGAFSIPSGRCAFIKPAGGGARINTSLWEKGVDFYAQPDLFREVCRNLRERLDAAKSSGRPFVRL